MSCSSEVEECGQDNEFSGGFNSVVANAVVTVGIDEFSNFEPGCEPGLGVDGFEAGPDVLVRDGTHGGELGSGEELCRRRAISSDMPRMCCDIPGEGVITDGDGPTGIVSIASDLGEGGGLTCAQCIELNDEEEAGCIIAVGVVINGGG